MTSTITGVRKSVYTVRGVDAGTKAALRHGRDTDLHDNARRPAGRAGAARHRNGWAVITYLLKKFYT